MKSNYYHSNSFNSKNATIWVVKTIKCKLENQNKYINIEKYTKGKIISDYSYNYVIAEFNKNEKVIINKKYILINLPDVMQKQVIYSISNATSAIYTIHGNTIPEVTGQVLYPQLLDDKKIKAPLMYRTAQKLFKAEKSILKNGLTIKIYDTYRPYSVTKYLYKNTLKVAEKYCKLLCGTINGFEYSQKWFLAEHASSHNYGVAIDMTLVDLNKNEELAMQTQMHDLSIFSVIDYNNENSNKMSKVMQKYGFVPLRSEWWHFQDNKSKIDVLDFVVK